MSEDVANATAGNPQDGETMPPTVAVAVVDGVATVTLNRPVVRNALTPQVVAELNGALVMLEADDGVVVVILTGADPAFCAGVDLRAVASGEAVLSPPTGRGPFPARRKLLIAAVNGPAVTGGLELALNCDFMVASERARFADTHARVGVMPGWGLTVLLTQRIGVARAREMSVTGNFVDAPTALAWGLVNHVVPHSELLPFCTKLAEDCASIDQLAVGQMLRTYEAVAAATADEGWGIEADVNRRWLADAFDARALDAKRERIVRRGRAQARD